MINSVKAATDRSIDFGFLDLGLAVDDKQWLAEKGVIRVDPQTQLDLRAIKGVSVREMGYLARPFLRENFPGYDIYVWIDADAWLQDLSGLDELIASAGRVGGAFITEKEKAYRFWPWLLGWRAKHFVLGYGPVAGAFLWTRPHINNGVFALRADAPHWKSWQERYQKAVNRTGNSAPHDQFGLNAAVYLDKHPSVFLSATRNWICDLSVPVWDEQRRLFCTPHAPFEPISIMHLAGPAKTATLDIRTTDGKVKRSALRYNAFEGLRHG